jgi:hypothetical protein
VAEMVGYLTRGYKRPHFGRCRSTLDILWPGGRAVSARQGSAKFGTIGGGRDDLGQTLGPLRDHLMWGSTQLWAWRITSSSHQNGIQATRNQQVPRTPHAGLYPYQARSRRYR